MLWLALAVLAACAGALRGAAVSAHARRDRDANDAGRHLQSPTRRHRHANRPLARSMRPPPPSCAPKSSGASSRRPQRRRAAPSKRQLRPRHRSGGRRDRRARLGGALRGHRAARCAKRGAQRSRRPSRSGAKSARRRHHDRAAARAARKPDRDAAGWRMLGWSYFETGRFDEAVEAYRNAVAIEPGNADYQSGLRRSADLRPMAARSRTMRAGFPPRARQRSRRRTRALLPGAGEGSGRQCSRRGRRLDRGACARPPGFAMGAAHARRGRRTPRAKRGSISRAGCRPRAPAPRRKRRR